MSKLRQSLFAAMILLWVVLTVPHALAQLANLPETKLLASDGATNNSFGWSVAASGDTVVVAAPGNIAARGAAYVFVRSGGVWTQQAKLTASDGVSSNVLGWSVAISGDTVVAGSDRVDDGKGAAYVFVRSGATWTEQAKLVASVRTSGTYFGGAVAVSGNTVIVGASGTGTANHGAAHVFTRTGTAWAQQATFNGVLDASFGNSVAIRGDTALIGAWGENIRAGATYVFVRSGPTWTQQARLTATDGVSRNNFGSGVAISGDTAVVGSNRSDLNAGAAYVFSRAGSTWTQQAKIVASDRVGESYFGESVGITGNTIIVGARGVDNALGASYVFTRSASAWTQTHKLVPNNRSVQERIGNGVAADGNVLIMGGPNASSSTGAAYVYTLQRRPVFLLPGIAATYALDVTDDLSWLLERGIAPSALQIDPLGRTYADLIQTLINAGYVLDKDLFVVNYDWRLTPGPDDGVIDGRVSGLTAASISANSFRYGVDYFGLALRRASERWTLDHPTLPPLDAVDVIAHSTGGLVARTYIQSDAYGGVYAGIKTLPKVNNLVMIGVPNRGASKAWNPLHDNWVVDPVFELVLAKIINRAYQKVLNFRVITGPDRNITLASLAAPNCVGPREVCFINQYVPTIRSLLATYDFLDAGSGFTHVNANPLVRNSLVLDLNAGLDLSLVGDPNAFASATLVKPTVIYGTNGGDPIVPVFGQRPGTPTAVVQRLGPSTDPFPFASLSIARFADAGPRNAATGETWYHDITPNVSGDGTVPLDSSRDQFVGDARIVLMPFTKGGNTTGKVDHTALPSNVDVQQAVLTVLGASCVSPCVISTGATGVDGVAAACAATGCLNFILDPVEGFVVDRLGRRLGYSAATGPLKEIPNSIWYGKTDGMGWVFGPVEEPLTLELTGLGGDYYTEVSLIGLNGRSGVVDQGTLAPGTHRSVPVPLLSGSPKLTVVKAGSGTGTVSASVGAINCGATCSSIYPLGTATTLTATATGGSAFTGWLGSCKGEANCALPMTDNVAATATFASAPIPAPKLDVDGTAGCGALTDGMLIMRHLLGLSGSSLTAGAVGTGATRNEAAIGIHLTDVKPYLDVDGNGRADPLTDGVLTLRYLFGLRGSALIAGAVGTGATRVSAADIEGRLLGLCAN